MTTNIRGVVSTCTYSSSGSLIGLQERGMVACLASAQFSLHILTAHKLRANNECFMPL